MRETWLRPNRRLLMMGMILPIAFIVIGLALVTYSRNAGGSTACALGYAIFAFGVLLLGFIAVQWRIPRLAYADGKVLVYLRLSAPIAIPVEIVECMFLAAGTGQIPGPTGATLAVRNLVIRLAEKATDFHFRPVKPTLGRWDEGYITIHGAWCEPLTIDVVRRLNERLSEVQRGKQAIV